MFQDVAPRIERRKPRTDYRLYRDLPYVSELLHYIPKQINLCPQNKNDKNGNDGITANMYKQYGIETGV